jgi:CRISPR/Cas system CMR subunit Cmr6 (Cas7 group RAMP superfamily)
MWQVAKLFDKLFYSTSKPKLQSTPVSLLSRSGRSAANFVCRRKIELQKFLAIFEDRADFNLKSQKKLLLCIGNKLIFCTDL